MLTRKKIMIKNENNKSFPMAIREEEEANKQGCCLGSMVTKLHNLSFAALACVLKKSDTKAIDCAFP